MLFVLLLQVFVSLKLFTNKKLKYLPHGIYDRAGINTKKKKNQPIDNGQNWFHFTYKQRQSTFLGEIWKLTESSIDATTM